MSKRKAISARRRAAQRANAQKSRGPVTPEGKARSAANAVTHGLASSANLAASVCLCNENQEGFAALHAALIATYNPTDPGQALLIQEMAVARWRQQRLWVIEAAAMDKQLCTVEPGARTTQGDRLDGRLHLALAFEDMAEHGKALSLLVRYEARLSRQYQRCLSQLLALQLVTHEETELPDEANPINEHQPEEENPDARNHQPAPAPPAEPVSAPLSPHAGGQCQEHGFQPAQPGRTHADLPTPALCHLTHHDQSAAGLSEPAPEGDLPLAA